MTDRLRVLWPGPVRATVTDTLLAVCVVVVDLLAFSYLLSGDDAAKAGQAPVPVVVGYALLGAAPLVWRRRAPIAVFAVLWVHSMAVLAVPSLRYYPTVGLLVGIYTIAAYRPLWPSVGAVLAFLVPAGVSAADTARHTEGDPAHVFLATLVVALGMAVVAFGLGRLVRLSRDRARLLERDRDRASREAVEIERRHIARELHDIVAHSVTVIVLQAAGAQRVLETNPERVAQALGRIELVGKQAMDELRRMLTVLRAGEDGEADEGYGNRPGLSDIDGLVGGARGSGIPVHLRSEGTPRTLDPSVSLTAYRIVQEALTNVTKHAPRCARTTLCLVWTERELTIRVTNDGPIRPHPKARSLSNGYGLLGLRERAALSGGQLMAGRTTAGGFEVTAVLPVAVSPAAPAKEVEHDHPRAARR